MTVEKYDICVEKYLKMVYRISFHYFGNKEDAEDVSQEVFMKLLSSKFDDEADEEIKSWLIRVTTNTCHNLFRNPFRRKRIDMDEEEWGKIADNGSSEQDLIDRKIIFDAVLALPEHYRIIVYLYYYEEYSIHQISNILNIKETTIQTRLARARDKLKKILIKSFPEKGVPYEI